MSTKYYGCLDSLNEKQVEELSRRLNAEVVVKKDSNCYFLGINGICCSRVYYNKEYQYKDDVKYSLF